MSTFNMPWCTYACIYTSLLVCCVFQLYLLQQYSVIAAWGLLGINPSMHAQLTLL